MARPKKVGIEAETEEKHDERLLLRFDPEEIRDAQSAPDGDPGYRFGLKGPDGKLLKFLNGVYYDAERIYVWPHELDVREFQDRGYRLEKYEDGGVRARGVEDADAKGDVRVKDHLCMSVPIDKWRAAKLLEAANGNRALVQMRRTEEQPIRLE